MKIKCWICLPAYLLHQNRELYIVRGCRSKEFHDSMDIFCSTIIRALKLTLETAIWWFFLFQLLLVAHLHLTIPIVLLIFLCWFFMLKTFNSLISIVFCSASVFGVSVQSMQCSYDQRGNSVPTILLELQSRLYTEGGLQVLFFLCTWKI